MRVLVAIVLLCASGSLARAQSALEWAIAEGQRARPAAARSVGRGFMRAVALAEGRLVRASWYGGGERLNRHTASGEVFRPHGLTAAHRTLPLGTRLAVSYGGRTVIVRVNDRGPAAWTGRSLDVSRGVAEALGFKHRGAANVGIAVVGR